MLLPQSPELNKALAFIRQETTLRPAVALVLGSGLGDFADELSDPVTIPTATIPSYPVSTVQGHAGKLVFGHLKDHGRQSKPLLVFQGRVHFYETHDIGQTLLPAYIASGLGAQVFLVTNAAGGINRLFSAGDLMLIEDYLNVFLRFSSPRIGDSPTAAIHPREVTARPRNPFDPVLSDHILNAAADLKIPLQKGTYCWLSGPSYETPAEIEMLRRLGADAVGMSTVPEIAAAHRLGMNVAGISLVSNMAAGMTGEKLSHEEVNQTAGRVKERFTKLMREVIWGL